LCWHLRTGVASNNISSLLQAAQDGEGWCIFHPLCLGVVFPPPCSLLAKDAVFILRAEERKGARRE